MKPTLTIVFLLISMSLSAQLYLTLEPSFLRPGILYNHTIKPKPVGIYAHAWYGNIQCEAQSGECFYTDNLKVGAGMSFGRREFKQYAGINYNRFFNTRNEQIVTLNRVHKLSIELGASLTHNRFTLLMLTDPLNWESLLGVTYRFHFPRKLKQVKCSKK